MPVYHTLVSTEEPAWIHIFYTTMGNQICTPVPLSQTIHRMECHTFASVFLLSLGITARMIVVDIAVQTQNAFWAIVFAARVIMETEKHARKMFVILILVKTVEAVFQLTHLMTVNARWDGLDHTVKLDNTAFQILAKTVEPASLKKMDTGAAASVILKEMTAKRQILAPRTHAKTLVHVKK